ncbi:hypothetical protein [Candidatus Oscillochloris fontis]|uniref:hypothetical protein n=1 Tax=Candidatus Oscillochloris fontis TaxID=2496868 RepID=UPI00101DD988|nr:hypothetical protein [Candidatus Oscillochloris fontis]
MTQTEMRLIEEGWDALVERLGIAEATRFVMLLDRRTGGALQHLRTLWSTSGSPGQRRSALNQPQTLNHVDL